MALTGTEVLFVTPVQANGSLGAILEQTTTGAVAELGGTGTPMANTAITTVGAGTLTAPAIVGGLITRTGPTAAYSDTMATAAQIVAAIPGASAGQSWLLTIKNSTAFPQTILTATGITLPTAVVVAPQSAATYLVTLTTLTSVTLVHIRSTLLDVIPTAQFTTAALTAGTLAVGTITGAGFTVLTNTGATPGAQTVRTAAQMLADFPGIRVGDSYQLRIVNTGAGTLTLTADAGPTVTITGTATVAQNVFRDYIVTFNTAATATIQSVGSGVSP